LNETRLTRSRPKHPAGKVATERDRITTKVTKSESKRRKNMNPNDPRTLRLAELRREEEAEDRPVTPDEMRSLEARIDGAEREREADRRMLMTERDQRIASEVDAKATRLMGADPSLDYSAATRMVIAEDENFTAPEEPAQRDESLAEAVERRMKADPANYPDELGKGDQVGSVHGMAADDYQAQLREAMERRGYDVD